MAATQPLAKIDSVTLRDVWANEANDFTPWLAQNMAELGTVLGIPLEAEERESAVGSRSLDILARDTSTDRPVVIENQLEYSDRDHLSRLLIYAAGKDADVVIWIARDFEDEHWMVLQWLNQRTDTHTKFFGVAIELWSINGSPPAPHFRVVAAPNDWRKRNVNDRRSLALSERKRKYRDFRIGLEERLNGEPQLPLEQGKDHSNPWLAISGGSTGFRYSIDFRERVYFSFQMDTRESARSLEWCHSTFDSIARDKEQIESVLGSLDWKRQWQGSRGSQIASYYQHRFPEASDSWGELQDWTIETYRRFRGVFESYRKAALSKP